MANWDDLRSFIFRNYEVESDEGSFVRLLLDVNDNRKQFVFVRFTRNGAGRDWVLVESPVGDLRRVDLVKLLRQIEDKVCGALSLAGNMVTVRHAVPLDDMNVDEFEVPLWAVSATADELEASVSLQDSY